MSRLTDADIEVILRANLVEIARDRCSQRRAALEGPRLDFPGPPALAWQGFAIRPLSFEEVRACLQWRGASGVDVRFSAAAFQTNNELAQRLHELLEAHPELDRAVRFDLCRSFPSLPGDLLVAFEAEASARGFDANSRWVGARVADDLGADAPGLSVHDDCSLGGDTPTGAAPVGGDNDAAGGGPTLNTAVGP